MKILKVSLPGLCAYDASISTPLGQFAPIEWSCQVTATCGSSDYLWLGEAKGEVRPASVAETSFCSPAQLGHLKD